MDYTHKAILLASMHEKERAFSGAFQDALASTLVVRDFNTDRFGTFSGEVERSQSPYETCVLKAQTAAEHYGFELAVASEGSFGPHPTIPFLAGDHEIMVFLDRKNQLIIAEQLLTENTNFNQIVLDSPHCPEDFLQKAGFPEHALIVQTAEKGHVIEKGIRDRASLLQALERGLKETDRIFLTTDMRAMMNPTRMKALETLAQKLVRRIATKCPACLAAGFGFKATGGHLSCRICEGESALYQHEIWACVRCEFTKDVPRTDGLLHADPAYCFICNP